jgi:hypothetical protein
MRRVNRFGTTWHEALGMIAVGAGLAFVDGLLLNLIDAPRGWAYVVGIAITLVVVFRALLPGAGISIEVRVHPPDRSR